ncbi:MAG: glutamine synthetase [Candidatus Margulisbacteria bacterium]|nr:glutamine synthetase [Candidatus Margulisiibacteriota bacterium]
MASLAEYIWMDGTTPSARLRSKGRVVDTTPGKESLADFPEWGFDGSSTYQAPGNNSDLSLRPVYFLKDPVRGADNYLVLCEVENPDGTPHETNSRALFREVLAAGGSQLEACGGFEQEYTFFQNGFPLGFTNQKEPEPQGPYYCSVGSQFSHGRAIVEKHAQACIDAGLNIYGINAEVMPGQWEYQIGYRGFEGDQNDILTLCDQRLIANWLLERIAEDFNVDVNFENKPQKGDWNGAGCHTNFSTKAIRNKETGKKAIEDALEALKNNHDKHIQVYGANNDQRLTGKHETCSIYQFRSGTSDRGASIRIPLSVAQKGYGYIEDRRPGANSDPYVVCARIVATVAKITQLDDKFKPFINLVLEMQTA